MDPFAYTRKDLDNEARRPKLPAAIRRTVKADGWALRIYGDGRGPVLLAYFRDENGRHEYPLNIAI